MRGRSNKLRGACAFLTAFSAWSWLLPIATSLAQQEVTIEAPQLRSMPDVVVPPAVALPAGEQVEAVITVAVDGTATLDDCQADAAICAAVADAIAAARFEPARREGNALAARIRIVLRLAQPPTAVEDQAPEQVQRAAASDPTTGVAAADAGQAANADGAPAASAPQSPPALRYGAKANAHVVQPGARRLELAEMRDLPGAFGDPFRAVEALPGVVPVLSGLPYFYIRGSPPAGTLYVYDDIPVPLLYHLAVGPAAIHPRMVGPITLYSGVAPARYGRLTGGVIVGEGPPAGDGQTHVESELRLLDVSGYVQADALGGTVTGAVRYGYPALLLSIFSPQVTLAYWDYQLRYAADLSARDRFELVALGSYDSLSVADQPSSAIAVTFHRFEARLTHRVARNEFGAALLAGWEESALGSQFQLKATRVGPRLWFEHGFGDRNRLRLSADMQGISGNFSSIVAPNDLNRETSNIGLVGNVRARSLSGVQLELGLRPWSALELQFGARGDAWVQSGGAQAVLDPRLRVILHASDTLDFHVAAGVVHQPAVFFLPLPGIADLANDQGLQTALQSEAGVGWDTPLGFRAELQVFVHRYDNLVFTDTLLLRDTLDTICSSKSPIQFGCQNTTIPNRIDGLAYGAELFIRRPITERLSGFISYTLALSAVDNVAGLHYTPSWDVRHVANLVLQWQMGGGFSSGLRWFVRSGKSHGEFLLDDARQLIRDEQRLPWFTRLDLELAYAWRTHWGQLRVALEWFNATLSREPINVTCSGLPRSCAPVYLPAIFFPNLSIRGEH